jgi:FolB domain-containing protein
MLGAVDTIELRGLEIPCVVGVYPHERHMLQPLQLDVTMWLDTERAARKEGLSASIDYSAIAKQLSFLLSSCEFRMLETAAHALARYLLAPPALGERRAQIERVRIRLTKPAALGGMGVPSLEIERERRWVDDLRQEHKPFGVVDVIHETRDAGIYRLNVAPGHAIPMHLHEVMRESEMVLTEGLQCQRQPIETGTVLRWPTRAAHCYDNPTERYQTILCVDSPRFIDSDEIQVDAEPVSLAGIAQAPA